MDYLKLVGVYEQLVSSTKRLDKTYYLANFLKKINPKEIPKIMLLLEGRVFPAWDDSKIGVASKLVLKAINLATGIPATRVEQEWKNIGDLGDVAQKLVKNKKQSTLFSQKLTVAKVFSNLQKLATMEGRGTVDRKIQLIAELLTSAEPIEAKYIVRTVLEDLRIGAGSGSIRDAIVWSYFPKIKYIFFQCVKCNALMPKTDKCLECGTKIETKIKDIKAKNELLIENPEELLTHDLTSYELITTKDEETARKIYNYLLTVVERSYGLSNDYSDVILTLRSKGLKGLLKMDITPFRPIKVMLYPKAKNLKDAFDIVGKPAAFEYKYDGFRMIINKIKDKIKIFTRNLEDVTSQFPDVVEIIREHVKSDSIILDSEAVGFDKKTTQYLPFQKISQRIKRKYNISELAEDFPVEVNVFDVLFYKDKGTISMPFNERRAIISEVVEPIPREIVLSRIMITDKEEEANKFYQESLDAGNEGVMAKNLNAVYKPGARVGYGVKLKPVMESLDLVIVGAEWGTGKRAQWLTSFTIACIDHNGDFLEIGKVGTGIKELEGEGLTFAELTELLKPLIIQEKGRQIKVKPKVVIEIHYEEIQESQSYSSGYALRFPRVVRLREDRSAEDASNLDLIEDFYEHQRGRN